jgi:hypothetical protein
LFQGAKQKEETADVVPAEAQADINIFTVASGLLYEVGFSLNPTPSYCLFHEAIRRYHDSIRTS